METGTNVDKKKLFQIIKKLNSRRKPKKVLEPQLKIEREDAQLFPDKLQNTHYIGKSKEVREAERNLCQK